MAARGVLSTGSDTEGALEGTERGVSGTLGVAGTAAASGSSSNTTMCSAGFALFAPPEKIPPVT